MLLDGNGLIYRGYFALPPLTTSKGELVNAVFGFCSIVLRGIQDIRPDYVAVAFDLQGPTFRHEQYAEYKATRQRMPDDLRDQFPKVREVVKALRIPVYELAGYEADDVIGTITVDAERRGLDTTIVTGDLDMLQLVTDHTRLMTTRSGVENTILYDPARIAERFDLVPGQMIDYKALKGDPTDNIPGVPGVGEKTAAKLIREFGTLEALYERIDEVKPDKLRDKLVEHRESVFMGKDLSTIVRDLPVEFDLEAARLGDYDRETVIRLFREYEFRSLIERLPAMTGETAGDAAEALRGVATDGSVPAARVAGSARPSGWGTPRAARPVSEGGGLQLSLDFDAVSRPAATAAPDGAEDGAGRDDERSSRCGRRSNPATCRPHWPPRSPTRRASRSTPATGSRPSSRGWRRSPRSASGCCSTTRGRARARRWRSPWPAPTAGPSRSKVRTTPRPCAGSSTASPSRSSDTRSSRSSSPGSPTTPTRRRHRSPSTRRSPRTSSTRRCAARPSPTSSPSSSTSSCRRSPSSTAPSRAGLEALSALAVREPLERRLVEDGLDRLYAEIELPLIAVLARMEATGVALDLDALQVLATRVRDRDLAARGRDLRSTSGTSSTSAAPSSSSRSCSSSSTCPRASGPRPATRPTHRCSRTSARPTR